MVFQHGGAYYLRQNDIDVTTCIVTWVPNFEFRYAGPEKY